MSAAAIGLLLFGVGLGFNLETGGNVSAVVDLLERVLPTSSTHFVLRLNTTCGDVVAPCFTLTDGPGAAVTVLASGVAEITAGVGFYLREMCNMTLGRPRGGGSTLFVPNPWPHVGAARTVRRNTLFSFAMNVCTHSYTLVWYGWADWEGFIDWAALNGLNLLLALTGQEEIQYNVFRQFGLSDVDIRAWFNGPAYLTWSRGQNSHGSSIGGPLPRSFMQNQWALQRLILARFRALGIIGVLPAFQGNVPWALALLAPDANITNGCANASATCMQQDTGWIDATDPLFGRIADAWMQALQADFGTQHWYQMDGVFHNGTTWGVAPPTHHATAPCEWSQPVAGAYLADCPGGASSTCPSFPNLQAAKTACELNFDCGGVTLSTTQGYSLRAANVVSPSPHNETSFLIQNVCECHATLPDPTWLARGSAAYAGLARTDPAAVWFWQGYNLVAWGKSVSQQSLSFFRGFVDAVPKNNFVITDMSVDGAGQWPWSSWRYADVPFVWTALHTFGGNDGMYGNIDVVAKIPFAGLGGSSAVVGSGYTPEGFDQNPAYWELLMESHFQDVAFNASVWLVKRAHRRYNLVESNPSVTAAWLATYRGVYSDSLASASSHVSDGSGVGLLPGTDLSRFEANMEPLPSLCSVYAAWGYLLEAVADGAVNISMPPVRYDVINIAREVLATLSTPLSIAFVRATRQTPPWNTHLINSTYLAYVELLSDLDALLATEPAFLLGPWLASARALAGNATDCTESFRGSISCTDFMEWNARAQITSWYPTPANGSSPGDPRNPGRDNDYARKHWNGLIADYYVARASLLVGQALQDAAREQTLNSTAVNAAFAHLAYSWTTAAKTYPVSPLPDAGKAAAALFKKYASFFTQCE